jgi:hypothetical protein
MRGSSSDSPSTVGTAPVVTAREDSPLVTGVVVPADEDSEDPETDVDDFSASARL